MPASTFSSPVSFPLVLGLMTNSEPGIFPLTLLGARGAIKGRTKRRRRTHLSRANPGQPARAAEKEPAAAAPAPVRRRRLEHTPDSGVCTLVSG